MSRDWRRPLKVLNVEPGDEVNLVGGRLLRSTRITFDRESTERIRSGYACAKCLEPFEQAWPERCPVCGAPIRERQLEYFTKEYAGFEQLGSRIPMFDGGLQERAAKEK